MELAAAAAAAGNSDEAYGYFTRVLEAEPRNYEAWFGKASAAGWSSTLRRNRYSELRLGVERAIEYAPAEVKESLAQRGCDTISEVTSSYFDLSSDHLHEFVALDGSWHDHADTCLPMLSALEFASELDPSSKEPLSMGILIAKQLLQGLRYDDPYDTTSDGIPFTKTHHLLPSVEVEVQASLNGFLAKMRRLDPTYETPEIQKATVGNGPLFVLGLVVAVIVLWLVLR